MGIVLRRETVVTSFQQHGHGGIGKIPGFLSGLGVILRVCQTITRISSAACLLSQLIGAFCFALSGLCDICDSHPRAVPWAILLGAFGAEDWFSQY
jgi:hypothetical protein